MPLYLPRSLTQIEDHPIPSTTIVGLSHTLSEFTGERVTVSNLVKHLGRLRRSDVIRLVGNLSATLSSDHGMRLSYQLEMAKHILPADIWSLVREKIPYNERHAGRLFHRRQIWFLLQMAITSCSEDSRESDALEVQKQVGLAALMASDVLAQVEDSQLPDIEDSPDVDQWVATVSLSQSGRAVGNEMICRAVCFWIEQQDNSAVRKKMKELGLKETLDEYFQLCYGIALRDFLSILVRAYYVFQVGSTSNPPESQLLEPSIMKGQRFSPAQISASFELAGISPDDLAPKLLGPRQSWATDFSPICTKPLIEVFPGKYTCADADIFGAYFVDGVAELLHEALSDGKFRELFGTMFEQYITSIFEEIFGSSSILARQFASSPKFVGPQGDQVADGMLLLARTVAVMEYKGGLLSRHQKFAMNLNGTINGINSLLSMHGKQRKGTGQLADSIDRILRGEALRVDGDEIPVDNQCKLIPTLIVFDDALGLHAIRNHLERRFLEDVRQRKMPVDRIGPLCLLTTRDVENLQDLPSGVSVEAVLTEYCTYLEQGRSDHTGSFHGFLSSHYYKNRSPQSIVQVKTRGLLREILEDMKQPEDPNTVA